MAKSNRRTVLKSYAKLYQVAQPGDVVAFGGYSTFSKLIKLTTRSCVSHVAIVHSKQDGDIKTVEAVNSGVIRSDLREDLREYEGEMWLLPLYDRRVDIQKMVSYLNGAIGKPYDIGQAALSAIDIFDSTSGVYKNREDLRALFCSELVASALDVAGTLIGVNASEVTPIDLCRFNIYTEGYFQIKGKGRDIRGYNSVEPSGWGM